MLTPGTIIAFCWAAFLLVWGIAALNTKKDIGKTGATSTRERYWLLRVVAAIFVIFITIRIASGEAHYSGITSRVVFAPSASLAWAAAALAVIGIAVAISARISLGRNWSSRPSIKENHELVTSGLYSYVRHPIYTGVILMSLGTALSGTVFGIGVFVVFSAIFIPRIRKEEKIMLGLFPNEYPAYQKRTKRLIPFIW